MSLTLFQINSLCKEIRPLLEGSELFAFESLEGGKFVLTFHQRAIPKHIENLLFCFKPPFLRFHLIRKKQGSFETPFTRDIEKLLSSAVLKSFDILHNDRILRLAFSKGQAVYYLVAEFFSKSPNLYLLSGANEIIYSLAPSKAKVYHSFPPPFLQQKKSEEDPAVLSSLQAELHYEQLELKARFEREKIYLQTQARRGLKKTQRSLEKCSQELADAEKWEEIHREGLILQANLYRFKPGIRELIVEDWTNSGASKTLLLDPRNSPQEELTKRFNLSRKLRTSIPHIQKRLTALLDKSDWWKSQASRLDSLTSLRELEAFRKQTGLFERQPCSSKDKPAAKKKLPYYEYRTALGLQIWVGKGAKENETLTFKLARGNDWWLHARGVPGSHVVLRTPKNSRPDKESVLDAMQLALLHSKAKAGREGEVIITQCKHVARLRKGMPGKVQVAQHKTEFIRLDQERLEKLKQRKSVADNVNG